MSYDQPLYRTSVDLFGCAPNERDTDSDGIVDSLDNCPTEARGVDGYTDGCPLEKQTDTSSSGQISGLPITWVYRHSGYGQSGCWGSDELCVVEIAD